MLNDLRYHELSRHGYYVRLEAAGVAPTIVEPEEVLNATTVPPRGKISARFGPPGSLLVRRLYGEIRSLL